MQHGGGGSGITTSFFNQYETHTRRRRHVRARVSVRVLELETEHAILRSAAAGTKESASLCNV